MFAALGCGGPSDKEGAICDDDGEFNASLPSDGALVFFGAAKREADELLGGDGTWQGDLRGVVVERDGTPWADGEVPSVVVDEDGLVESSLVAIGWHASFCLDGRQVEVIGGSTESIAVCAAAEVDCNAIPATALPELDSDEAIEAAFPENDTYLYNLQLLDDSWRVSTDGDDGYLWYVDVDTETGEILPCEDWPPRCVGE